jgi:hypothetical protein
MILSAAQYKGSATAPRGFLGRPPPGAEHREQTLGKQGSKHPYKALGPLWVNPEVAVNSASFGYFLGASFT